jgi:hypothetical protein
VHRAALVASRPSPERRPGSTAGPERGTGQRATHGRTRDSDDANHPCRHRTTAPARDRGSPHRGVPPRAHRVDDRGAGRRFGARPVDEGQRQHRRRPPRDHAGKGAARQRVRPRRPLGGATARARRGRAAPARAQDRFAPDRRRLRGRTRGGDPRDRAAHRAGDLEAAVARDQRAPYRRRPELRGLRRPRRRVRPAAPHRATVGAARPRHRPMGDRRHEPRSGGRGRAHDRDRGRRVELPEAR